MNKRDWFEELVKIDTDSSMKWVSVKKAIPCFDEEVVGQYVGTDDIRRDQFMSLQCLIVTISSNPEPDIEQVWVQSEEGKADAEIPSPDFWLRLGVARTTCFDERRMT